MVDKKVKNCASVVVCHMLWEDSEWCVEQSDINKKQQLKNQLEQEPDESHSKISDEITTHFSDLTHYANACHILP